MKKVLKTINKHYRTLKIVCCKFITNLGLKIVTRKSNHSFVKILQDVSYGKNKLQKYDIIYPTNKSGRLPVIFYVHGGAWCSGDKYGYTRFCTSLAEQGYVCVNINYRLMPKVSIRVTYLDCVRAIKHFCKNNKIKLDDNKLITADLNKTFMVGDSAGAHLVSLISGKITTKKIKLDINPIALGLYYGVFDFNNLQIDPSPILTDLYEYLNVKTINLKKLCKEISTTTYITSKFPPSFVTSGKIDKLNFSNQHFC